MLTNSIVGIQIDDAEFPSTLDRLTEKVKAEKSDTYRKSPRKSPKSEKNENRNGHQNGNQNELPDRKRKSSDDDQNDDYKKTRTENDGTGNGTPDEKPNWKLMKQERKELKESRKMKKAPEMYELTKEAKIMWECVRQESTPADKRVPMCKTLYKLLKPHVKKLVFAHDMVRVLECLVAVGPPEIRNEIFDELKPDLLTLMKNKYSHFFVLKMLKYGDKEQRSFIMKSMEGEIVSLLRLPVAAAVVESAYNDHANAKERSSIIQEFFGPEFRVFKDEDATTLDTILTKFPGKKEIILKNFKQDLLKVISKSPWKLTIVHTLLKEFLNHCDAESRSDLVELLKNDLIHILHTRDGARVAMMCLWHGTPKDRKIIVKSFKTHVEKICTEEHGYMVMLALFDCVDDTILVSKALLQEMLESIEKVLLTEQGRKVILYLLQPRAPAHFHPQIVEILAKGDGNQYSKKENAIRQKELLLSIQDDLIGCFERNLEEWIKNVNQTIVLKALIEATLGPDVSQLKGLLQKLVSLSAEFMYIEKITIFKTIKSLIVNEKANPTGKIKFTDIVLSKFEESGAGEFLKAWLQTNRGTLVFVIMLETGIEDLVERVRALLKPLTEFITYSRSRVGESTKILLSLLK